MVPVGEVQPELVSRRTRSSGGGGGGSTTGQPWGHIIQLFGVKEALENNGIGTRLQSAIEQWAREVSCLPVSTRTSIVASATTATSLLQAHAQRLVVLSVKPCHPREENYWLEKVRRASAPGAIATTLSAVPPRHSAQAGFRESYAASSLDQLNSPNASALLSQLPADVWLPFHVHASCQSGRCLGGS